MKKILLLFLLISTTVFAQQFDKEWKKIMALENVGRIRSANRIVDRIYKKAVTQNDEVQMIKCFFHTSKYLYTLDENAKTKTLANLKRDINRVSVPSKALLNLVYAKFLIHYRDYGDTEIMVDSAASVVDYETTSVDTTASALDTSTEDSDSSETDFYSEDEITELYKKTLENASILKSTPLSNYEALFYFHKNSKFKKQTLFDYLLEENIAYFSSKIERWEISENEFVPYTESFFGNSEAFIQLNLDFITETNLKNTLFLYQQKEINDPSLENQFERVKFCQETFLNLDDRFETYLALIEKKAEEKPLIQKIKLEQVSILVKNASKTTYPENNIKALALIDEIVKINENSYPASDALEKKAQILSKSLSLELEEYIYPNKNTRALIYYQNVERFKISFFKISLSELKEFKKGEKQDSLSKLITAKRSPVVSQNYDLLNKKDYFNYTTEVLLPKLTLGHYLIYVESDSDSKEEKAYASDIVSVSNLMVLASEQKNTESYQVLDRKTGKPVENAIVKFKNVTTETNTKGIAFFTKTTNEDNNLFVEFSKDGDSLMVERNYYIQHVSEYNPDNRTDGKIEFYLDRAIYRPGQTVFYKGIAFQKNKNKSSIVPNARFEVSVYDVNNQVIKKMEVTANEFGSFSGEFVLPKNGLTGNFSIVAQKVHISSNEESKLLPWYKVDFYNQRTSFRVEEYKRPKFEVTFEPKKESFKLNQVVKIKGNAKAFAGSSISDAIVKYNVTRYTSYYRNYYGREEKETLVVGETKTDASGKFSIDFKALPSKNNRKEELPVFNYQIEATVTDLNGETHTAQTIVKVGYHDLILNASIPSIIETKDKNEITLSSTNLNGEFLAAKGEVKLYLVSTFPSKFKRRIFQQPDIKGISDEDFEKLFPYEINKNEDENKIAEVLVFSKKVDTQKDKKIVLDFISNYKSGTYKMVFSAKDSFNNPIENSSIFQIKQSAEKFYAGSLLTVKKVNDGPRKDGFVLVKVTSPIPDLYIIVSGNYQSSTFFEDIFHLESNETVIKIPLKDEFENQIKLGFESVFENSSYTQMLDVALKEPEAKLEWTVESFRSKIEPGSPQNWSFKLNGVNTKTEAEVLASMYDSSLDQFSIKNWQNLNIYRNTYNSINFKTDLGLAKTHMEVNNLNEYVGATYFEDEETQLNWFGFNFNYSHFGDLGMTILEIKDGKVGEVTIKGDPDAVLTVDEPVGAGPVNAMVIEGGDVVQRSPIKVSQVKFVKPVVAHASETTENPEYYYQTDKIKFIPGKKIVSGLTSMAVNTSTLYIIDGETLSESDFNKITPEDVLSIDFLTADKAKALYGSKGANGVIIITTKKAMELLTQVKTRKNLSETAFFFPHLKTDSNGNVSFNFTSPEALTAWKLRLLAHNKDAVSGYLEKSIITQKELMILPNLPRLFREKDTIVISAKISNVTNEVKTGIASLQFFDAVTMEPIDAKMLNLKNIKNFTIPGYGNTTANWTIAIPEGLQGVQYKIVAKSGNFSDGEENILPVLTNNMLVTESIPLWVRENSTKEYTFENLKNNNSSTLRNHQFTLEYTSNPTWIAIQSLPYLMEYEHECAEQTFARYYANALASEIISSNPKIATVFETCKKSGKPTSKLEENEELKSLILAETPWLNDAQSEEEKKKNLALLFDLEKMKNSQEATFEKLKRKQSASGGFPWFDGYSESEYITRHILAGLGHLAKLSKSEDNENKIDQIAKTGIPYLDNNFLEYYRTRTKNLKATDKLIWINPYSDLHYLYTRSFYLEKYPMSDELKKASKLYLETAKKDWLQYSLYEKGLAAITLNRFGEKETAKKIIESLKETSSNNEDWGMYWIANKAGWYWYQAPIETQALLIEAFAEVTNDTQSVDAMKVWLLKNKQTKNWPTTKSTTEAIYALLMQGRDWLSVKDNTVIKIGNEKILTKKLADNEKEAETGYIKMTWKAEEVKKEMASIKIENKSKVPGYGGVYWQYFEDLDKIKTNSGAVLSVSKELYLKKNTLKGDQLEKITSKNSLKTGDLVTVRLIITSKEDMEFVHLKDMRASCFEPVNVISEYQYKDHLGYYMSTKDAATHFFFDTINKGTYVIEYDIRVNNSGEFSNGITTIQSMYAPEFSSHTKGIRVKVQ
ncbi:alpha-2-macroglobulin family protein [Flavobacterium chilense]|uniref:TonB-dependent outer membrane receptor, SusC/RagA subfamily, signature region n=1 Tax=Flavobacterium chilense TaxID=946677 RepID=A0A1M7GZR7_9FLAO|nr:alpha-2-macroglobulin family protein [Flavobacterium chilense]SHM21633.1 TonB-dependent outer membrane receptor, SusC/RagA subfamily, signature region [Flavobacterium chilense]